MSLGNDTYLYYILFKDKIKIKIYFYGIMSVVNSTQRDGKRNENWVLNAAKVASSSSEFQ